MVTWTNVFGYFLFGWTSGLMFSIVIHFVWKTFGVRFIDFWSGDE